MIKKLLPWMLALTLGVLFWTWRSTTLTTPLQVFPEAISPSSTVEESKAPATVAESDVPVENQNRQPGIAEISDFRDWAKSYLSAPQNQRKAMLPKGEALAEAHTQQIAAMIRIDPQQAIANAVPMVVRQDLPESIERLLEKRVSMKAALEVYGNVPLPGAEASPDFKPYTRSVTKPDGSYWNAYVYGARASQRTMSVASINGISVGNDMAVAEAPARQLETGERPSAAGREVVEICPVSEKETVVERTSTGELPAISEETPALETEDRIVYVCSGGHITQVLQNLTEEEERAHWESMGVYLNAGAGSGAATAPIGTIPGSATTGHRKFLYIRATFPDHRVDPQSEAECQDMLRQMADYISQTSYGRCYFTYAVAPLVVLPYPESWYLGRQAEGAGGDTLLQGHARTIAKSMGYDHLSYDLDAVRWAGGPGSYGGSASVGGRGMRMRSSSAGTFCHELGHNLGVWHANYWRTTPPSSIGPGNNAEYGNTFDVMGSSSGIGQFTAHFKNTLNWLPNETHWTVTQPGTYRIHQFDYASADPSFRYALRIKKDAERDYWAEFRQRLTTNTGFTNGLMMTWDGWGLGNIGGSGGSPPIGSNKGAQLLDMTPGSFGNGITDTRNDSALWIGRTFSDNDTGIHVTPIAKNTATTPPSMDVYVSVGAVPGNLPPALAISASSTNPATSGSITLTATASDPNGDPLAYAWVFSDGTYSTNNSPSQTKSWTTAGHYQVLCTASDMKGKRTTRSVLITVGTPTTFTVKGNITGPDSLPLEGVYVANYAPSNATSHPNSSTFRGTWTDSDGNYTLTGLATNSYTISPNLYPNVFTPSGFTNPVSVGPSSTGKNFTSGLLPSLTINVTDPTANEGTTPGTGKIRLERTGSTAAALPVQIFNTNTGTATKPADYTLSPAATASTTAEGGSGTSQYDIPAGAAFLDITVTPVNDSTKEGTEYAALNFANTSGGYILAGSAVAVVDIIDDEGPTLPVVTLTHLDNVASENSPDFATLKLERNGATTSNLTVNFTLTGTATNVTDYAIPTSVVIPAGSASTTFTLTPVDDSAQEETETAIVTITTNTAYARDTQSQAQTITIHDNDQPTVTLVATDATATEAAGNSGIFTITRIGGNPYQALTVDYAIAGPAVHGVDYRRLDGRATIPAGASSTTVEIQPFDDTVDEGTQDVILQLRSTTAYRIGGTGIATLSITDNDNPQVYPKLTTSGVTEPATGSVTAIAFQIIRPASGTAMTVNYAISGTATSGTDFTALPGTIAFATGDTSKTINVSALADTLLENAETVTITLLPGTGYTLMASQDPSATGFILDGDQPTVDVSAADTLTTLTTQATETTPITTPLRFIVARKVSTASDLVVNYTMSGTATEGTDYTGTTGSVTILANTTSAFVTIVPVNDTLPEGVESIVMSIAPGAYGLRTPSATILLGDNDTFASGSAGFAAASSTVAEDAGTHNVAVNVTGTPLGDVTVNYRVSSGTATGSGYDFTLADGLLTFPPGTTTLNIPISIYQDIIPELSETIALSLYNATGGNLGTSTHTVTINNRSMPEAFTDATTNLLANSVTLNGRTLPNGLATDVWFQYGSTSAYGSTSPLQSIGSGTASVNVTAPLSGFAPGGYHFRLVAQNSAGTTYGINQIVSSNNADLASLAPSAGTLSPVFSAATIGYMASVSNATTSITITPTLAQANATVKVNGTPVTSGTPSGSTSLAVGVTPITILVTAQDGTTTKTYTVNVTRPPSTNADLASITPSAGTLSPTFSAATLPYTATVPNATSSLTITPTLAQINATVKVNGTTVASGTPSATISLAVGITPITVLVTAQDGTTTKTYTLNVTRPPSNNADLANLTPSAGTLSPAFGAATLAYTATVTNATGSLTITPTLAQADATLTVNGTAVVSGTPSAAIPLAVGVTPIVILVTAQDATTTKTYTVNVTRAPSTNADVASLTPDVGTLSPAFDAATIAYTASFTHATTSLAITPTLAQADATLTVNGTAVISGTPSAPIPLAVGVTPITVLVTAQDGTTIKTYTLNVTRAPSTNADLASLTPDVGTLSPAFDAATIAYTSSFTNATSSLTITPTLAQADATLTVNGTAVVSGTPSAAMPLAVGVTPIIILVTAQDGTTTKTYTLSVTRAPSNNADLASLTPSAGTLSPAFSANTIDYTAEVSNETNSMTIIPTLAQADATVAVNGTPVVSGTPSAAIPLAVGITPITILVTAQDGTTTQTYTVNVNRDAPLSDSADLAILTLSVGTLSPAFSPSTIDYMVGVANETDSMTITPTLAQPDAIVTVNGTPVISGTPSAAIPLSVGVTPVSILVKAQDGTTTTTYTVNVTRDALSLAQWQISFFGSSEAPNAAPGEDSDFDGINNLLEYVLGGIPVGPGSADSSILPTCSVTETAMIFSFRRTKSAAQGFFTIIETTSTFAENDWTSVANGNIAVESIDTLTELVTATLPLAPPTSSLFVRLKVRPKP